MCNVCVEAFKSLMPGTQDTCYFSFACPAQCDACLHPPYVIVYSHTAYPGSMLVYNYTTELNSASTEMNNATMSGVDRFGDNETTQNTPTSSIICNNATNVISGNSRTSHDALLYIVTVLLFYSLSMVILMVKYIRREKEEAEIANYYSEFVSREKFKTPKFEIQNYMKLLKYKQEYISERSKGARNEGCSTLVNVPLVLDENQKDEQIGT